MTIQLAYKQLLAQLYAVYDNREAANIADMVIEHVTGQRKIDRIVYKDLFVTQSQEALLATIAEQLVAHKPVQYVLEKAWFMDLMLQVNEHVLIPRPETEELVQWIISDQATSTEPLTVIDIGTGSGCIPIAIKKKLSTAQVSALDYSAAALDLAKKNAIANHTEIQFIEQDFLDETRWLQLGNYNVAISNPPYIARHEAANMQQNVLAYEPHLALFVPDNDPLVFYKKIASFGQKHVTGYVYVELNERLGIETAAVFAAHGYTDVEIRKDMQGKNRMLKGSINLF